MHGAQARDGAVRRPRGLDLARRLARPGDREAACDGLLRPRADAHRDVRRDRREVRRRRGARRLRCADRARGRCRACGAGGGRDRRVGRWRAARAGRDRGRGGRRRRGRLHLRDRRGAQRCGTAPAVRGARRDPHRPDRLRARRRSRDRAARRPAAQGLPRQLRGAESRLRAAADRPSVERRRSVRRP